MSEPRKPATVPSPVRVRLAGKLLLVGTLVTLLGFSVSNWQPSAKSANSTPKSARLHYSLSLPEPVPGLQQDLQNAAAEAESLPWKTVEIKSGDTLASIFASQGIAATTTHNIARLNEQTRTLRYIQPGEKIQLLLDDERGLRQMKYIPDITRTLLIQRNEQGNYDSRIINYQLDAYPVYREGVIENSLFVAAANADIPEDVIMDMVAIFGWDIDFALDIRKGDRFRLVYEELYKDDVKIRNGRILSAEFVNNGKTYNAVYYTDPSGNSDYYTPEGKSMRKAFLRSPVKFSRISSRFSKKRWHPVLSKWRSHKGVDYAAARGTPVRASGDGKVIFAGTKGGYGKLILIRHGGRYTTAYGHLHRYARGIRSGKKVKQGQVIGYVGSTGLATGPHLHYEFRVNGVHRNPLTVKLPEAEPVHPSYLTHFENNTRAYLTMLRLMDRTLADNSQ
ncbi:MAG: peptidoglycan DD-metalloendopeptidase family protein [Gammaproteobacteria bacterium]|nr:peptidoglycan DD-metalloendopeptidase family protein [Gammaproteobacteria bacterium]